MQENTKHAGCICDFSAKFEAHTDEVGCLLYLARYEENGVQIVLGVIKDICTQCNQVCNEGTLQRNLDFLAAERISGYEGEVQVFIDKIKRQIPSDFQRGLQSPQ